MDLRKAFDLVNHVTMLEVLEKYGVRGVSHRLFESYLADRKQMVKIDDVTSQESTISSGVVQGSCLGHLLFLIFINAIGYLPRTGQLFLFADDAVLVNIHETTAPNVISDTISANMAPILKFFAKR